MIIGYTTGVFDLFHIGHLNILRESKKLCDKLIVGVTIDELVKKRKNKNPIIPYEERYEIIKSIKYVDQVVPQTHMDKYRAWKYLKFDVLFVGNDWKGHPVWNELEKNLNEVGVEILYFPYTNTTSSTLITNILNKINEDLE